jgi:hypothetical protein
MVGIFANEYAIVRLIGAICSSKTMNGPSSALGYMALETIAPLSDDPTISLPAIAS